MIVLASGSATRLAMLQAAGVACSAITPGVDEAAVKDSLRAEGATSADAAEALAELKAVRVSCRRPDDLVIGADQMLDCDGRWFDKPATVDDARAQLKALSGRTHDLVTCAVAAQGGQRLWHHVSRAKLGMRPLSDAFIDDYLARAGDAVLNSVGGYQVEGLGAQLFSRIEGDHFTILGLPLLPLLDFLRAQGILKA